jgi:Glycosyltransferase WbsX
VRFFSFFPQFCPEPLNDKAWGNGFTDWDLIRRLPEAQIPSFTPAGGFYNPSESGYFDSLAANLTATAGLDSGLMLYHYYFDGVHALSGFEKTLINKRSTLPIFICWANESWSKRWEGKASEIIIRQTHRLDQRLIASHATYLTQFFGLKGYLRVGDRPIFVIYDPHATGQMANVVDAYRHAFAALDEEPLIGACLSYPQSGIAKLGFDFVMEFEPRYFFNLRRSDAQVRLGLALKKRLPRVFDKLAAMREKAFAPTSKEKIIQYSEYLNLLASGELGQSLNRSAEGLPLIRSSFLHWNNLPRYKNNATKVSVDSPPAADLQRLSKIQSSAGFPLVVNSWNEWSEGAAFEPGMIDSELNRAFLAHFNQSAT